ncbi:MAG: type IX secretion system membrane protein PorP/SprF [Flavobacteriales bacterium]|nr:type IX secretion system membrane protein PorP/SprF [Flavobacteriales bacterium]
MTSLSVNAQQDAIFSNYIWNPMSFNPAIAGTKGFMTMNATVREQWVGFEGRPRTQAFNMHTSLRNKALGVGASIINDKLGPINSITLQGNLAYKLKIDRGTYLSMGLKSELSLWQGHFVDLELADDPTLANNIRSAFLPNFGFGLLLKDPKYFVGISVPKFLNNELNDGSVEWGQGAQVNHYFAHAGYSYEVNRDLFIKPSLMVNYVRNVPLETTISLNAEFQRQFWVGMSYRTAQAITPLIAYKFNHQVKAGYAFEMALNSLISHQAGSHELMITYDFYYPKGNVVSPIFF